MNPRAISRERAACIDKIERMRALNGASTPLVEKAHRMLLPRYWARASWRTRAETLTTVDWLLRIGEGAHRNG